MPKKENTCKTLLEMMLTMMFMLTAINLVPTTSREMAKTIMKIPWAPIPVTSLPQLGLNRVYIAMGLAFFGSIKFLSRPIPQIAFFWYQNQTVDHIRLKSKLEELAQNWKMDDTDVTEICPTEVHEDNMGCLKLAQMEPGRITFAVHYHWFRSKLDSKIIIKF